MKKLWQLFWNAFQHLLSTPYDFRFFLGPPSKIFNENGDNPVVVDWKSMIVFFLFLAYLGYFIGYPISFLDTARYMQLAINLEPHYAVMEILSLLERPVLIFGGPWLLVAIQWAICAYLVTVLSQFVSGRVPRLGIGWSLFTSAVFIVLTTILVDVHTMFGLVTLFLLVSGAGNILIFLTFIVCVTAHLGNLYIFFICYLILLLIRRISFRRIAFFIPFMGICLALLLIGGGSWFVRGEFVITPQIKLLLPAVELMNGIPEAVDAYTERYPTSIIALSHLNPRERTVAVSPEIKGVGTIPMGQIESENFFWFTVKQYPGHVISNGLKKTWDFMVHLQLKDGLYRQGAYTRALVSSFPGEDKKAKLGLQQQNALTNLVLTSYYTFFYFLSIGILLIYLISELAIKRRKSETFYFCAFVIVAWIVNAAFMANAAGIYGRYQVKVFLLPLLGLTFVALEVGGSWWTTFRHHAGNLFAKRAGFRPVSNNVLVIVTVIVLPVLFYSLLHPHSKSYRFNDAMQQVLLDDSVNEKGFYAYYLPGSETLIIKAQKKKMAKNKKTYYQATFYKRGKAFNRFDFSWPVGGASNRGYLYHFESVPHYEVDSVEVSQLKGKKAIWTINIRPLSAE